MRIMEINSGRWTARIEGDFVVFLIGAEVRDPGQAGRAAGLLMAMVDVLGELAQDPGKGLLGFQQFGGIGGVIVQYWRSFEALEAYAKNPSAKHAPVWREWNRLAEDERSGPASGTRPTWSGQALRGDLPEHANHRVAERWHGDHGQRGPRRARQRIGA